MSFRKLLFDVSSRPTYWEITITTVLQFSKPFLGVWWIWDWRLCTDFLSIIQFSDSTGHSGVNASADIGIGYRSAN